MRLTLLGDLDPAAADADLIEHHLFRGEGQRHAAPPHIAPIAGTVSLDIEPQNRIDDDNFARLDCSGEKRADIEPGFERLGLEKRLVETSLRISDRDVVEFELGRRQKDKVNFAANLHLPAEEIAGLGLEQRPVVVPVDEERRGKERA